MQRQEFLTLIGGAATSPLAARAQQGERVRRIGVLMNLAADDAEGQARLAAFLQGLQEAGWAVGRNVRIDLRWGAGDADHFRKQAAELVALAPDVVLASGIPVLAAAAGDPHRADSVRAGRRSGWRRFGRDPSAARRQCHRFYHLRIWARWEMGGTTQRDHAWRDAGSGASGCCQYLRDRPVGRDPVGGFVVRDGADPGRIERRRRDRTRRHRIRACLERRPDCDAGDVGHRSSRSDHHACRAAPTTGGLRPFATAGGLISYGPDSIEPFRLAAGYVDRILKGERPSELPVQAPTKFELVINLKTAKTLGLTAAVWAALPRRRGDRISGGMSAFGTKRTSRCTAEESGFYRPDSCLMMMSMISRVAGSTIRILSSRNLTYLKSFNRLI